MNRDILVCVKTVPSSSDVQVDSNFCLRRDSAALEWNLADESALEAALRLRGRDVSVTVLSMGPPKAAAVLQQLYARGADRVILLSDPALAGADTRATAAALAHAAWWLGMPELILCGRRAIDGETGQIPGELAAALGFACVSNVESIEHAPGGQLVLRRRLEDGIASVSAQPGLVVSLCEYSYPLRLPGIMSMRRSLSKSVELITAGDIGLPPAQCGLKGSPTRTVSMQNRYPGLRRCTKETDVEKGAAELVRRIREVRK